MGAGKIIQLVGVLVALVAGAIGGFAYSGLIIVILGLAGGWFIAEDDRMRTLIGTLALIAVQGALSEVPAVGGYITGALGGLAALFSAAAVMIILVSTFERVKP